MKLLKFEESDIVIGAIERVVCAISTDESEFYLTLLLEQLLPIFTDSEYIEDHVISERIIDILILLEKLKAEYNAKV